MTVLALLLALSAFAIFAGALWLLQERLIFFPQPLVSASHLPRDVEPIDLAMPDGVHVRGWLRPATRRPAPVLLYFGGNAEEVSWTLADRRWPADWSVVAINYRGYGASEGRPGETGLAADALAIYDWLVQRRDVDAARVVLLGRSLGTALAVKVAARRPVAGVVLVSPFDSLLAVGRGHYPWLPVGILLRHRFDARQHAGDIDAPLLAFVAERDPIVPLARSRALFDAWRGPKGWQVVRGTNHDTVTEPAAFWATLRGFLDARA